MRKPLLLLALLLPILWFGGSWAVQQRAIGAGSRWVIPVEGYDPRDLVRGHYIRFRYAWQVLDDPEMCREAKCDICLAHAGGGVTVTLAAAPAQCRNRVDPDVSEIRILRIYGQPPQFYSRIFVSESAAPQMEPMLRAGGMAVETALTADGRLVNRRLVRAF